MGRMNITIISFTKKGIKINLKLGEILKAHKIFAYSMPRYIADEEILPLKDLKKTVKDHFGDDAIIFVGATGIAIRAVAAYLKDKFSDPAIIVIDELGRFVIPILSGHVGGANELAEHISKALNAIPVITTATDINGLFAIDIFAKKHNLIISSKKLAKDVSSSILDGKEIDIDSDIYEIDVSEIKEKLNPEKKDAALKIRITNKIYPEDVLTLIPKNLCLGIGCKKDTQADKLWDFVSSVLSENRLDIRSVRDIASIDVKKNENAILELSKRLDADFYTYTAFELSAVLGDFNESEFVKKTVGVGNVCERAALKRTNRLLIRKVAKEGMTLAIGEYALNFAEGIRF